MLRLRFLWKFYASYLVLLVITTTVVGLIVGRHMTQDAWQTTRRTLLAQAMLLRSAAPAMLSMPANAPFHQRLRRLGTDTGTHFTLIQADGTVVADSAESPSQVDNQADYPEITATRASAVGTATRISPSSGQPMMYLALPIRHDGALLGYVRSAVPLTVLKTRLSQLYLTLFLGVAGAAFAGLLLSILFAHRVMQPLRTMTEVATSLAGGYTGHIAPSRKQDELDILTEAFNRMAYRLRERMETIIKDRNQLLAVLSGMVEGVIAVDENECVVHMNQAAGAILYTSPATSIGKRIWEVTRVRAVMETISDTIRDAEEITCEARIVARPEDRILKLNAAPLRDSKSALVGAVLVLHDVTALRRLERVRRDFVANVSHELKTPITNIKGFVETLRDDLCDEPEQTDRFLGIIARNADRLHAIIEDLLSLSRLEQSEETADLVRTAVTVHDVLQAAVQDCTAKAMSQQIRLQALCDTELCAFLNAPLIEQALVNLLDNAINYSKAGSMVWVEARYEPEELTLCVRDEGIGIASEQLPRLFERFYRVDKARSRDHGGTGLGLAIVKHIAQLHGGHVSVTSAVGQGSTFTLYLPMGPLGKED